MPIPFILAGIGIATGVIGGVGHACAKETNEKAEKISRDAQRMYNNEKDALENMKNKAENDLLQLGYSKKNVLESSMKQFVKTYDKIKNISITASLGMDEISNFCIDNQDIIEINELSNIYSSVVQSGVATATTSAIIALASSGSLSIVTSGLSIAGTALAAGEITSAASIAGAALSFGASMTPLVAVAAPVIFITAFSASTKADENLEKAEEMYAEAEEAVEKMKVSETLCKAISERSKMFNELLIDLDKMFSECVNLLDEIIKKKEKTKFWKRNKSYDFSQKELELIAVTRALAGAEKTILDTPILSKQGNLFDGFQEVYNRTSEGYIELNNKVEEVIDNLN